MHVRFERPDWLTVLFAVLVITLVVFLTFEMWISHSALR